MEKLKFNDFIDAVTVSQPAKLYLSYDLGDFEICLEPCSSGYDVAVYKSGDLIGQKKCTDFNFKRNGLLLGIQGLKKGEANMVKLRAVKFANEFYKNLIINNKQNEN